MRRSTPCLFLHSLIVKPMQWLHSPLTQSPLQFLSSQSTRRLFANWTSEMPQQPAATSRPFVGRLQLLTRKPISMIGTKGTSHTSMRFAGQLSTPPAILLSAPRFVPKFCHRHLPVGIKAHRNDPKYSPSCPACGDPLETNSQFLLCSAPSRLAWRKQFLTSLEKELRRLQTSAPLILFLVSVFHSLLEGIPVPPTERFAAIVDNQASIGWMALFRGYWSSEWLVAHQNLVLTSPVLNEAKQKERYKKQEQWLGKVASLVMRQVHTLWILRNNERHGVTPAEKESRL
jgi:hypothetical protein